MYGGGIYLDYGTLNLNSGAVIDSHDLSDTNDTLGYSTVTASYGGGIHLEHGVLNMEGCTINGNQSQDSGAGIQFNAGTLNIGGFTYIYPDNDVQLASGTKITITSELKGTTPVATISPFNYTEGTSILVAASAPNVTLANEVGKFEVVQTDKISIWSIDDTGKLKKDSIATTFPVVNDSYVYSSVDGARSWISTNGVLGLSDAITQDQVIDVLDAIYSARVSNITLDLSRVAGLHSFTPDITQFYQYLGSGSCPISVIIFPESVNSIDWSVFQYAQSLTAYFMDVESTWTMSNGGSFSAAENGGKASYSHIVSGGTWNKN